MPEWVFWVVGFAVIAGLGAYGAAQRTKQAEGLARKLGFRFIGPGGYDVVGPFVLLGYPTTIGPGLSNLSRGDRDGVELTLFDYQTEGNAFTSLVLRAPGLDVPHVAVQPPSMKSGKGRVVSARACRSRSSSRSAPASGSSTGPPGRRPPASRSSPPRSSTAWSGTPVSTWKRSETGSSWPGRASRRAGPAAS
jgi:hypothetical protein